MRQFEQDHTRDAIAYAVLGGQALHIFNRDGALDGLARKLQGAARELFLSHHPWAHLFDQDYDRLLETCKRLGVNRIVVERKGTKYQHVDLIAGPLARAIAECEP